MYATVAKNMGRAFPPTEENKFRPAPKKFRPFSRPLARAMLSHASRFQMIEKAKKSLEGEGSYSATRRYNAGLAGHARSADVAGLGKKAAKALDGPEGPELRKAEKQGKQGPRAASSGRKAAGRR